MKTPTNCLQGGPQASPTLQSPQHHAPAITGEAHASSQFILSQSGCETDTQQSGAHFPREEPSLCHLAMIHGMYHRVNR
jgi:hypothetical protein